MDYREAGTYAEVFSAPAGYEYTPHHPCPPSYIRVKAQNRRKRDLDRLFLAQILSKSAPRSRKGSISEGLDAKIHGINERPVEPPPNSTRTKNNAIWAAEVSKDGQYYAAGGQDKKLKVWRIISSREDCESSEDAEGHKVKLNAPVFKQELVREYEGHTSAILDLSWSKNNFLLSSSMDKTVRLYHISRPECLCAFKHNDFVTSISFHPRDDRFFLAGSLDSKVRLWSIPDKNVAYWAQVQDMVTAVAFTPDGKTAIAGTLSGLCILYDTEGLKAHSQIHVRSNRGKNSKGSKITGIETIQVTRQSGPPDVKILITSNDSRVRMYNLRDRSLEAKFRGNENSTSQIRASFSDDGKFVICGSEDKRVYVWPTGSLERQDSDKRPVEVFEAHTASVTTALILPTKSRRLLARSGDPIYDLCNPPPVRLLSRSDSVMSSRAPTEISEAPSKTKPYTESMNNEESPQYAAKHSHDGGLIIVTGDYTGEIKVFRQDCAYQKRRDNNWDTASFSKKMLGRSGSVTTKTSERSSINRKSITPGDFRNPPGRDNIIDWRNSIVMPKSGSAATSTSDVVPNENYRSVLQERRDRSSSPGAQSSKRSLAHRFSLRHGSTPLSNSSRHSLEEPRRMSKTQEPNTEQVRPETNTNGTASTSNQKSRSTHFESTTDHPKPNQHIQRDSIPSISFTGASPTEKDSKPKQGNEADDNGLFLVGDQSFMAYDVQHSLIPMAHIEPRTPAPGLLGKTLSRGDSFVSTLSNERASSISDVSTPMEKRIAGLGINEADDDNKSESEELKCKKCGSESFSMVKSLPGRPLGEMELKCRRCGELVVSS